MTIVALFFTHLTVHHGLIILGSVLLTSIVSSLGGFINAVYANKIAAIDDPAERDAYVTELRKEYEADIDLLRLASELVIDAVVEPEDLRSQIVRRISLAQGKDRQFSDRRHGVPPV